MKRIVTTLVSILALVALKSSFAQEWKGNFAAPQGYGEQIFDSPQLKDVVVVPLPSFPQEASGAVINVMDYGATGNGSTDDTAAVQAAINAAGTGNTVYFPHGNYCINGGITLNNGNVQLTGGSSTYGTGSNLRSCNNADVTTVTVKGQYDMINHLAIAGPAGVSIKSPAVFISSAAANFSIVFSNIAQGYYALMIAGSGGTVAFNNLSNAYGPAIIYATGSDHYIRNTIDQNFPVSTPGIRSLPNPLSAWGPVTSYSVGHIAVSGGWLLQCKTAGTSGVTAPILSTYGTDIPDGSLVWRLVAPSTYYGMQLDTGVAATQISQGDFTGPYAAGIAITNNLTGNRPNNIKVTGTNFGNNLPHAILANAGTALYLSSGNTFTDCLQVGCSLVSFSGAWVGQSLIVGNMFRQGGVAVEDLAGQGLTVVGNLFAGFTTAAFHVASGQSQFNFSDNDCSKANGGSWGTNSACVIVDSGASSHYIITDNLIYGAANGIEDNSGGGNVSGNQ